MHGSEFLSSLGPEIRNILHTDLKNTVYYIIFKIILSPKELSILFMLNVCTK